MLYAGSRVHRKTYLHITLHCIAIPRVFLTLTHSLSNVCKFRKSYHNLLSVFNRFRAGNTHAHKPRQNEKPNVNTTTAKRNKEKKKKIYKDFKMQIGNISFYLYIVIFALFASKL